MSTAVALAPAPIPTSAAIEAAFSIEEQNIKSLYRKFQIADARRREHGLAFGKAMSEYRDKHSAQGRRTDLVGLAGSADLTSSTDGESFSELLERLSIPSSTAYKWINRYEASQVTHRAGGTPWCNYTETSLVAADGEPPTCTICLREVLKDLVAKESEAEANTLLTKSTIDEKQKAHLLRAAKIDVEVMRVGRVIPDTGTLPKQYLNKDGQTPARASGFNSPVYWKEKQRVEALSKGPFTVGCSKQDMDTDKFRNFFVNYGEAFSTEEEAVEMLNRLASARESLSAESVELAEPATTATQSETIARLELELAQAKTELAGVKTELAEAKAEIERLKASRTSARTTAATVAVGDEITVPITVYDENEDPAFSDGHDVPMKFRIYDLPETTGEFFRSSALPTERGKKFAHVRLELVEDDTVLKKRIERAKKAEAQRKAKKEREKAREREKVEQDFLKSSKQAQEFYTLLSPSTRNQFGAAGWNLKTAKAAYKQQARIFHPDRNGNSEQMSRLNLAWDAVEKGLERALAAPSVYWSYRFSENVRTTPMSL